MYDSNNDYSIIDGQIHCQGYGSRFFSDIIFNFDFSDYLSDDCFNLIIIATDIVTMIIIITTITILQTLCFCHVMELKKINSSNQIYPKYKDTIIYHNVDLLNETQEYNY